MVLRVLAKPIMQLELLVTALTKSRRAPSKLDEETELGGNAIPYRLRGAVTTEQLPPT